MFHRVNKTDDLFQPFYSLQIRQENGGKFLAVAIKTNKPSRGKQNQSRKKKNILCLAHIQGLRERANPTFAFLSIALVSTSPEIVKKDPGVHWC